MYLKVYFNDVPIIITTKAEPGIRFSTIDKNLNFESLEQPQASRLPIVWQLKTYDEWKQVIKERFKLVQAGGGIVARNPSEILLIFRRGKWDLPKGKLDEGEKLEACAVREVTEETGLAEIILKDHLTTTYHSYFDKGKWVLKESVWFMMQTSYTGELHPQAEEDIEECRWVPKLDLHQYRKAAHASVRDIIDLISGD